jgi:hypothetical protein
LALAKTERELNLSAESETTFAAALATIEKISDPLGRGFALLEAAATRAAMGDADQAKALLTQLEKSLESIPTKIRSSSCRQKLKRSVGRSPS